MRAIIPYVPNPFLNRLRKVDPYIDLALRVTIPAQRLFLTSDLSNPFPIPEYGFIDPKDPDLSLLEQILRLLETPNSLVPLSHYFEALDVSGGSLTDRHWTMKEDKLSMSIWSMLSYYSHCKKTYQTKHPELFARLEETLIDALGQDKEIFSQIYEYEQSDKSPQLKQQIERRISRARLNPIKRILQTIFEYEALGVAIDATEKLELSNREESIQWLILVRESLKVMASDLSLNIPEAKSVKRMSGTIKLIRDYFEHPGDYALKLGSSTPKQLEKGLFEDLVKMKERLLELMTLRYQKIERLLTPHPSIAIDDALATLQERQEAKPSEKTFTTFEAYPKLQSFLEKLHCLRDKKIPPKEQPLYYYPKSENETLQDVLAQLRDLIPPNRSTFLEKLQTDIGYRFRIQRKIAKAVPLLKRRKVEHIYSYAKEIRNFNTHDIWRLDPIGMADVAYLLGFQCEEELFTQRPKVDKQGKNILRDATFEQLTLNQLQEAVGNGFNLNAQDSSGRTLLHFLAEAPDGEHSVDLAKWVLDQGASVYIVDEMKMSPLHYAAESGFTALAKLLIENGAVVDAGSSKGTPLERAEYTDETQTAQLLASHCGTRRNSNARALLEAIKSLNLARVEELLEEGVCLIAEYNEQLPLVALFSMAYVDTQTLLAIARRLVEEGADIAQAESETGNTPLHVAVLYQSDEEIIHWLLAQNPPLNTQNYLGDTPLHNAARLHWETWLQALLQHRAHPDVVNHSQNTPLINASSGNRQNPKKIHLLLEAGANPDHEGQMGRPLHYTANRGTQKTVALLLRYGASPFPMGSGGNYYKKLPIEVAISRAQRHELRASMLYLRDHFE